jgi:hypothetical protein
MLRFLARFRFFLAAALAALLVVAGAVLAVMAARAAEFGVTTTDTARLEKLSKITGGRILPDAATGLR